MDNKRKRILIIEDTPEIRIISAKAFEAADFEVEMAEDGNDGLKRLKNNTFDMAIMDIVMPNQTGFEIMNQLKSLNIKTPIMVYSNMDGYMSREEALKMGAIAYFEKLTVPIDVVVEKVKTFFSQEEETL